MTLSGLNVMAGLVAVFTMSLIACADEDQPATIETPVAPSMDAPMDSAATPTPPGQLPSAPPEIVAPGDGASSLAPTDPTAPPPGSPPPVLPESPN